jgi:hypothetical protein
MSTKRHWNSSSKKIHNLPNTNTNTNTNADTDTDTNANAASAVRHLQQLIFTGSLWLES